MKVYELFRFKQKLDQLTIEENALQYKKLHVQTQQRVLFLPMKKTLSFAIVFTYDCVI